MSFTISFPHCMETPKTDQVSYLCFSPSQNLYFDYLIWYPIFYPPDYAYLFDLNNATWGSYIFATALIILYFHILLCA